MKYIILFIVLTLKICIVSVTQMHVFQDEELETNPSEINCGTGYIF